MNNCEVIGLSIVLAILILVAIYAALTQKLKTKSSKNLILMVVFVLVVIAFIAATLIQNKEKFYFEVSPGRKKCLEEQVSRKNFGKKRSCSCCGRGTVGGIPPNYAEWLNVDEDTKSRWHRPDFVEYVDTFSNAEEATCNACGPPSYKMYL